MRRRDFIKATVGAVIAQPFAARAEQATTPLIGFLSSRSPNESEALVTPFVKVWAGLGMSKAKTPT
jgi:hypothetical protein